MDNNNHNIYYNFEKALTTLKRFLSYEIINDRDRAGIVQGFKIAYECCWQTLQKIAILENFEANSPRESIMRGLELGIFDFSEEEDLIKMVKDRNSTPYLYEDLICIEICDRIQNKYCRLLEKCLINIKNLVK